MSHIKYKSFTLVELIVVISIIAVLSVISILIISEYLSKSRDTRRLGDLSQIEKALELAYVKNSNYPSPDNSISISADLQNILYQGKFCDGASVNTTIKTTPKDPFDDVCYTYSTNNNMSKYEIIGFLESSKKLVKQSIDKVYAIDYTKRIPTIRGDKIGIIILSGTNQPVEDIGSLNISGNSTHYIVYFSDNNKISGTGIVLKSLKYGSNLAYGLIGNYSMEDFSGNYLFDNSGKSNHGLLSGTTLPSLTGGKIGTGLYFDGISSNVDFGDNQNLQPKEIGISFWFKTNSTNSGYLFRKRTYGFGIMMGNPNQSVQSTVGPYTDVTQFNTGNILFQVFAGQTNDKRCTVRSKGIYNDNNWHFLTATYDKNNLRLFIDNKEKLELNCLGSIYLGTDTITMGKDGSSSVPITMYNGYLDEVRMYDRAISIPEIEQLYNASK